MRRKSVLNDNYFIIMWDELGLECIIPVDMVKLGDGGDMLAKLEDGENKYAKQINRTIWMLKMRARFNSQRHYEIYCLITNPDITEKMLREQFEYNPQGMVDLIREKGVKIHSDRANEAPRII